MDQWGASGRLQYKHLSIENWEIRILNILCEEVSGLVHCTLQHTKLTCPDKYVALSYCWGNPNVTRSIVVDGHGIHVTVNL
jgi:hypothetical protein